MRFRTIPKWLHKPFHNFDSNWAPLSVVIVAGVPNGAIYPLKKASATISALISISGMASGQRVKRSTQVSRYLKPSAYSRGPTISICMWSNLSVASSNLPKTGLLCRDILAVWQPLQERHHLAISVFISCQTNLVLINVQENLFSKFCCNVAECVLLLHHTPNQIIIK